MQTTYDNGPIPYVSVCVVTYNQEHYIRQCLESVIRQEASFSFEIIVGDDASTDATTSIVREFAGRYPDIIQPLIHPKNIGPAENYRAVHKLARGQYVAYLDGDDLMLPGRLRQQAQTLDSEPSCSAVFHQLQVVDRTGSSTGRFWPDSAPFAIDMDYLLKHHPAFGHSSMMYRRGLLKDTLEGTGTFIDFQVYVELASRGFLRFLPKLLGQYRQGVGLSVAGSHRMIAQMQSAIDYAASLGIHPRLLSYARARQYFLASHNALYYKDYQQFRQLIEKSVGEGRISSLQQLFHYFRGAPRLLLFLHKSYVLSRESMRALVRNPQPPKRPDAGGNLSVD